MLLKINGENSPMFECELVKPIQQALRQKKNLVKSRPNKVETDLMGK